MLDQEDDDRIGLLISILDKIPDGIIVALVGGQIIFANAEAEMLTGYHRERLRQMNITELVPSDAREGHIKNCSAEGYFIEPRIRYMGSRPTLRIRDCHGIEIPVEIMLAPVITTQGMAAIAVLRRMRPAV